MTKKKTTKLSGFKHLLSAFKTCDKNQRHIVLNLPRLILKCMSKQFYNFV